MIIGFERLVKSQYIDLDKMAEDGVIDRDIEQSQSGYYPVIVVPEAMIDKIVVIMPLNDSGVPMTIDDMFIDKTKTDVIK